MASRYQLKRSVYSNYHKRSYRKGEDPRIVYGKAFDVVVEVADHGSVKIVQGKDGERFPVQTIDLKEL